MKAMNTLPKFPPAIYRYVKSAFRGANKRVCELLARVPNCPEQALDMTLINFLSAYAAPAVVAPGWFVRIDVYFIGGLRHFNNWEIGDIGVLIFAKRAGTVIANKLAVLQSKRLYPDQGTVIEQTAEDFRIGMGTLLPGGLEAPLSQSHLFPLAGVQIQGTDRRGQSIQGDSGLRGEASHPGSTTCSTTPGLFRSRILFLSRAPRGWAVRAMAAPVSRRPNVSAQCSRGGAPAITPRSRIWITWCPAKLRTLQAGASSTSWRIWC